MVVLIPDGWYRFESFIDLTHFKQLNLLLNERVTETRKPDYKVIFMVAYVLPSEITIIIRGVNWNILDIVKQICFTMSINKNVELL
jgi:hypothetical protein